MKILKLFLAALFCIAIISCSGGGDNYQTCIDSSVKKAQDISGGNIPADQAKKAAEMGCAICKSDPKGDACEKIIDALK